MNYVPNARSHRYELSHGNEEDLHTSFENYQMNGYGHNSDLSVVFSHQLRISIIIFRGLIPGSHIFYVLVLVRRES